MASLARAMVNPERLEVLAARAYAAYWERVTPKHLKMTPFKRHAEAYKEDWRRVVRAIHRPRLGVKI